MLLDAESDILAVVGAQGELVGVVTDWDIVRATAQGLKLDQPLTDIMSREWCLAASPQETITEMIHKLEVGEISSMPVVDESSVRGMVSTDLLARGARCCVCSIFRLSNQYTQTRKVKRCFLPLTFRVFIEEA